MRTKCLIIIHPLQLSVWDLTQRSNSINARQAMGLLSMTTVASSAERRLAAEFDTFRL